MKRLVLSVLTGITLLFAIPAHGDDLNFVAKISPGVHVGVHADVVINPSVPPHGDTVLYVHGMAHQGNAFRPLAGAVFSEPNSNVRRAILLNMPARGGSSIPFGSAGVKFGDMSLSDYATILIRTLERCCKQGISPSVIVGHSMGGLVIQVAQEDLLSQGTSLNEEFGVGKVTVIGSASPSEVPDPFLESGAGLYLLSLFTSTGPLLGSYVSVDATTFVGLFFTDKNGVPVSDLPTPLQIVSYKSVESLTAAVQTVGTSDMRPSVRSGAFAPNHGTVLRVLVGEQDPFSDIAQERSLYEYLTGDMSGTGFTILPGANAVHDQIIAYPHEVAPALGL